MTTLREAAQQMLEAIERGKVVVGCHLPAMEALRDALAQPDIHPQCAQGCEFLAMEQRRNEREVALKERGFE